MTGAILETLRAAWRSPSGRAGLLVLGVLVATAVLAPPMLPDPLDTPDPIAGATPPALAHPFGTDPLSRDILARVVAGARVSLSVAALGVIIALTTGAVVGLVAGHVGGLTDTILMRMVDGAMAIPRLFALLLLTLVWERIPLGALIVVIGATGWFGTSRLVRGEVLRLRDAGYVTAARSLGAGSWRLITRHLLPNTTGPLLVAATLGVGEVILLEAGLSFLGVGVQPPTPSWGGMILDARPVMLTAPWASLFPGLAIVITVLAVNLVGDALRAAFDPRNA